MISACQIPEAAGVYQACFKTNLVIVLQQDRHQYIHGDSITEHFLKSQGQRRLTTF